MHISYNCSPAEKNEVFRQAEKIDVVVVKKLQDIDIDIDIDKKYNIFEYKLLCKEYSILL